MLKQLTSRHSIRLKGYDYSQSGLYFITICVQNKHHLFGEIENHEMIMNDAGMMIKQWYQELECKFNNNICHEMIIIPNHFHCILEIKEHHDKNNATIGTIIQWFKTMTTNDYIRGVKAKKWKTFDRRLWQRNYWEHIIRNNNEHEKIAQYIIDNPLCWSDDKLNV
ncbi:transposase [Flammeovirga sp. EKP202]|uniref:transposase n=1 Tax=Flammeovirga sp. EKP202 TaxID=2770592 RepID=UPI00165EC6C9|nr:transposase [Flammeovirga sp. EKP202]MBD0401413.1 transposase [Flammeovirga sp. EKP202]